MIKRLYAEISGVSQINSISITENHNSSTTSAVVSCGSHSLDIGDDIDIYMGYNDNYPRVFRGYVKQIDRQVPDGLYSLTCKDILVRAVDFFIVSDTPDTPFSRSNIWAEELVGDVLALAGITNYGYDPTYFKFATGEMPAEVNVVSAYDYCNGLADLLTWHLYADQNGKVWFVNRKPYVMLGNSGQPGDTADTPVATLIDTSNLSLAKTVDEKDLRNRVVVYGGGEIVSEASSSTSYDPETGSNRQILPTGFYKTALLSSSLIGDQGYSDTIATYNLQRFNRIWYKMGMDILGNPDLHARSVVTINSTAMGTNSDWYIMQLTHNWSGAGFITNLDLIR